MAQNIDDMNMDELQKAIAEAINSQGKSKTALDKLTASYKKQQTEMDSGYAKTAGAVDKLGKAMVSTVNAVSSAVKGVQQIANTERTLSNFSSTLGTSTKILTDSSRATAAGLDAFGNAIGAASSFLPGWGKIIGMGIGGVSKVAASAIGRSADIIDSTSQVAETIMTQLGMWQKSMGEMTKVGGMTAGGLGKLLDQADAAKLSIGEWTGIMSKNAAGLAVLGGTVSNGIDRMAGAFNDASFKTFQSEIVRMGGNLADANEQVTWYAGLMAKTGRAKNMSDRELIKGSRDLFVQMDALARLTGTSKEQQKQIMEKSATKPDWQAFLSILDESTRKVYNDQAIQVGNRLGEDRMLDYMNNRMNRIDRLNVKEQFQTNQMFYGSMSTDPEEFSKQLDLASQAGQSFSKQLYMLDGYTTETSERIRLYYAALDKLKGEEGNRNKSNFELAALAEAQTVEAMKTKNAESENIVSTTYQMNEMAAEMSRFNRDVMKKATPVMNDFAKYVFQANKALIRMLDLDNKSDYVGEQEKAGGYTGAASGALLGGQFGAGVGSAFGGVGAVPGVLIGAGIGAAVGYFGGSAIGRQFDEHPETQEETIASIDKLKKEQIEATKEGNKEQVDKLQQIIDKLSTKLNPTEIADTAAVNSSLTAISKLIGKGEANNSSKFGAYGGSYGGSKIAEEDVSKMTFAQVKDYQKRMLSAGSASSAVGKGQFVSGSLQKYMNVANLNDTDMMSPENQEKMINGMVSKLTKGKSATAGADALANEWASLQTSRGKGRYDGDGLNKASIKFNDVVNALSSNSAADGGLLSGSLLGYPATLHGTEMVTPVNGGQFPTEFNDAFHKMLASYNSQNAADLTPLTSEMNKVNSTLSSAINHLSTQVDLMKTIISELSRSADASQVSASAQRKIASATI